MRISLKKIIVPQLPVAILLLTFVFAIWVVAYLIGFNFEVENNFFVFKNQLNAYTDISILSATIFSLILTAINTFLIVQINRKYSIIRTKTFLPTLIFNLLIAIAYQTHGLYMSHLALSFCLLAIFLFLGMFRNRNASEAAFMGAMFLAIASLMAKPLILLMLFFWIGFIPLKSFSLRTFLASIFGILVPWFFYLLYSFYYLPNFSFADAILSNFKFKFVLLQLPINQIVYLSGLALVLLVSLAGLYSNLQSDSIQTRSNIRFISIFSSGVLLLFLLFNQYYVVLAPIFIFSLTFLLSHPFSLRKSNFFSIIFIIFVLVNILYFLSIILLLPI